MDSWKLRLEYQISLTKIKFNSTIYCSLKTMKHFKLKTYFYILIQIINKCKSHQYNIYSKIIKELIN